MLTFVMLFLIAVALSGAAYAAYGLRPVATIVGGRVSAAWTRWENEVGPIQVLEDEARGLGLRPMLIDSSRIGRIERRVYRRGTRLLELTYAHGGRPTNACHIAETSKGVMFTRMDRNDSSEYAAGEAAVLGAEELFEWLEAVV